MGTAPGLPELQERLDNAPRLAQGGIVGVSVQGQGLDWMILPLQTLEVAVRSPHNLPFSGLSIPSSPSLTPEERNSSDLNNFMASSGLTPTLPCPYYIWDTRTGDRTAAETFAGVADLKGDQPKSLVLSKQQLKTSQ
ncbi:hypothetical protein DUI87_14583 [Hirundo rustica rustica]|uniref:Uncharacterized protein n=1 Tax=Hirundo rustica rustica TaxID=333673 RepID=A0A3M0K705_HIRRU|nr:hypothetical protein DUI87_14583 [Hirundo rustica rustica]